MLEIFGLSNPSLFGIFGLRILLVSYFRTQTPHLFEIFGCSILPVWDFGGRDPPCLGFLEAPTPLFGIPGGMTPCVGDF